MSGELSFGQPFTYHAPFQIEEGSQALVTLGCTNSYMDTSEPNLVEAVKKKRIDFYLDTRDQEEPFLQGIIKEFIEIETWTECAPDGKGSKWTHLKTFKTTKLPSLPSVR